MDNRKNQPVPSRAGGKDPRESQDDQSERGRRRRLRRLGGRFTVALAGATLATLALGGGGAQAATLKLPIDLTHVPATQFPPTPRYTTPTANLDKVANALQFKHKSVTTLLVEPAGLAVTNPVDISVSYDNDTPTTQSYINAAGNHFLYDFVAVNGQPAYRNIHVAFTEHVSATQTQHYDIFLQPYIEPLFDISVSPLTFHLDSGCDWIGSSEPVVEWDNPQGGYGQIELDMDGGQTATISAFAHTYTEVGASAGLRTPSVVWWEDDPFSVGEVPPPQTGHLLPGASFTYSLDTREATGQDCTGRLTYSVTDTLRFYPFL